MNTTRARSRVALQPGVCGGCNGWIGRRLYGSATAGVLVALVLAACPAAYGDAEEATTPEAAEADVLAAEGNAETADQPAAAEVERGRRRRRMSGATRLRLIKLVEPAGILTLSLLAATVCLGVLRRVKKLKPRQVLRVHKIAGVTTLVSGVLHATLIVLVHSF